MAPSAGGGSSDAYEHKRSILVAIDLTDQSHKAIQWTAFELCRPGDVVHLVHVARVLSPQTTIQHAFAGSSYTVPDPNPIDEQQYAKDVTQVIKSRFSLELDQRKIPHSLHMFLDTFNAPASAICASIFKVAQQVDAALIVMACHNKAYGWDTLFLGSVADYATQNSTYPVMIIRDYKLPFIMAAASKDHSSRVSPRSPTAADAVPTAADAVPTAAATAAAVPTAHATN